MEICKHVKELKIFDFFYQATIRYLILILMRDEISREGCNYQGEIAISKVSKIVHKFYCWFANLFSGSLHKEIVLLSMKFPYD